MEAAVDDLATIELEPEGGPTRRRKPVVALAVAALLVAAVGGGAVVVGSGGQKASQLPKLPATATQPSGASAASSAQPSAYPNSSGSSSSAMYPYRSVHYQVAGTLPDLGSKAAAYQLGITLDRAAGDRLAAAFGLHGTLADAGGAWQLTDGGKTLTISKAPGLPWFIGSASAGGGCISSSDGITTCSGGAVGVSGTAVAGSASASPVTTVVEPGCPNPPVSPTSCSGAGVQPSGTAVARTASSGTVTTVIAPGCPRPPCPPGQLCPQYCVKTSPPIAPTRPADLPSQADAEKQARALLAQAGLNLSGATVMVQDAFYAWSVDVAPRVGSLPTQGWSWQVSIGPRGTIESAHGYLDTPRLLGDYPLAGSTAGLARLQAGPGIGPMPLPAEAAPSCPPGVPCAPTPPTLTVTVTGVHLALSWEGQYLAPVYVFEAANGQVAGIAPAVADGYLQPASTPTPKTPDNPVPVPQTAPAPGTLPAPMPPISSPCGPPVGPGLQTPTHCLG